MNVFIYGPSCSGKSTFGIKLAKRLNRPFYDLDVLIEENSQKSIPEIFSQDGEEAFRNLESRMIAEMISEKDNFILSLGGGSLVTPHNQKLISGKGKVLFLNASQEVLLQRLKNDQTGRPLLNSKSEEQLIRLLEKRREHYASFPLSIDTGALTEEEALLEAQTLLGEFRISGMGPAYDVLIQNNSLKDIGRIIHKRWPGRQCFLVTDPNVDQFHSELVLSSLQAHHLPASRALIGLGEEIKNLRTVEQLYAEFLNAGLDRDSLILALGGGIVGDLTGFAAASFMRGLDWVNIPTTLLAMCDSSLGGKTGANLPQGKNLIGAFHAPKLVLVDPAVLLTLPEKEMINGMAEVLKHGIIRDPKLLRLSSNGLEGVQKNLEEIIRRAVAVKAGVIVQDPYEKDLRKGLNFGHTIGHGIELASNYEIPHGFAVSIGMVLESRLAWMAKISESDLSQEFSQPLARLGLPVKLPEGLDRKKIIEAMLHDKKRSKGKVSFALPLSPGNIKTKVEIPLWQGLLMML